MDWTSHLGIQDHEDDRECIRAALDIYIDHFQTFINDPRLDPDDRIGYQARLDRAMKLRHKFHAGEEVDLSVPKKK